MTVCYGIDKAPTVSTTTSTALSTTSDEFETRPPFAAQLRGIRVTIRIYEPSSQQIRQVTVVGDFLPD